MRIYQNLTKIIGTFMKIDNRLLLDNILVECSLSIMNKVTIIQNLIRDNGIQKPQ
jgi:hypothetical protein